MAARLSIAIKAIKRSARFQTILRLATLPKYTITSTQPRKIQLPTADEVHVHLAVKVVADDRTESKEENDHRHKGVGPSTELPRKYMLGEFDPSELSAVPIRREENNHGRGRADEHGVDKDAQGLH